MKLVIREYLSMLKESGELDELLPDLLLSMDIIPLSKAQVGVRQYGVDVAAVGLDPDDRVKKLFLLTIKKGNLSRDNWDVGKQALRPSLNEIIDTYITNHIDEEHKVLAKKIIVCCNGDIQQDAEQNWIGYKKKNTKPGIEFDFWGADKLASMIESYFLTEYIFPEQLRKYLRKTIALADQNEEPRHFYALIEEILFEQYKSDNQRAISNKEYIKLLSILNLNLNIVFHWCSEANNLKPALLCAERSVLRAWDFLVSYHLLEKSSIVEKYYQLVATYSNIVKTFIKKLKPYSLVKHGLFGWTEAEEIEYPLRIFEAIGIAASYGIYLWDIYLLHQDEHFKKICSNEIQAVANIIQSLIVNNPASFTPLFDHHTNDIVLGLIVLKIAKKDNFAEYWLKMLSARIFQGYKLGHHFPIHTNSYDDLISLIVERSIPKEKLFKASTILTILADWYAILDSKNDYIEFQESANKIFSHANFMLWFPDDNTDDFLYETNAGYKGGTGIKLPIRQSLDDIKERIVTIQEKYSDVYQKLSCIEYDSWFLIAIASRHLRTPVLPFLWHQLLTVDETLYMVSE